jgi:hypothetical protein
MRKIIVKTYIDGILQTKNKTPKPPKQLKAKNPELLSQDESFKDLKPNEAKDLVQFLNETSIAKSHYAIPNSFQLRSFVNKGEAFDKEKRYLISEKSATGNPIGLRVFGTFPKFKEYPIDSTFEVRLINFLA